MNAKLGLMLMQSPNGWTYEWIKRATGSYGDEPSKSERLQDGESNGTTKSVHPELTLRPKGEREWSDIHSKTQTRAKTCGMSGVSAPGTSDSTMFNMSGKAI